MRDQLMVSAFPHAFRSERVSLQMYAGLTIAEIVASVQPDPAMRNGTEVRIAGHLIPESVWHRVRPRAGHLIEVAITLHKGGGGKNPLRTIMSIVLLAAGAYFAPMLGGIMFGAQSAFATAVGGALISFAGNLALNALIPPPSQRIGALSRGTNETSQYFSIEGARNRARPWEKIPKLYGRHRLYGDLGAHTYTETDGDDQYMRGLIVWGYGPMDLQDFRIGETAIEEFEGVEIEHRHGYPDDEPLTLFTNNVMEDSLSIQLKQEDGWQTRTTRPDIDEIGVEFVLPNGLVEFNDRGDRVARSLHFEVQYAPTGTEDWSASLGGTVFSSRSTGALTVPRYIPNLKPYMEGAVGEQYARVIMNRYSGAISVIYGSAKAWFSPARVPSVPSWGISLATILINSDMTSIEASDIVDNRTAQSPQREHVDEFKVIPGSGMSLQVAGGTLYFSGVGLTEKRPSEIRRGIRFPVPRGQYDVRARRVTADTNSDKIFDKSYWSRLRSIRNEEPILFDIPVAKTAFRIKASGQLNSFVDTLNCIAHSILPVYDADNDNWDSLEPTSNPASCIRDALQGTACQQPVGDSLLDLESFEAFYLDCEDNGYTYNGVHDYKGALGDVVKDIASAGRAFVHQPDGRYVIAMERVDQTPVQHFTPKNTWAFEGIINYPDLPHALNVRFPNADKGWRTDMRSVFIDGYNKETATKYQQFEMPGITDEELAWKHARYHLAVAYNRRETFSFWTDARNLQCVRGDFCYFSHDVPRFGAASGRIVSVQDNGTHATGVTLDERLTMDAEKTYVVRFQLASGVSLLAPIVTDAGDPDDDGVASVVFTEPVPLAQAPKVGDLFMFGETNRECVEVLITRIETGPDLTARIICQPRAPIVHEADQGEIPDWTSALTAAPTIGVPVISPARSDGTVLLRDPDGSLVNRILLKFERPSALFTGLKQIQARFREAGSDGVWSYLTAEADQGEIGLVPVEAGLTYEYQLRWLGAGERAGEWSALQTHLVAGKEARPSDIVKFSGQQNGDVCLFRWKQIPDLDAAGYDIRYIESTTALTGDALWLNMTVLKEVERGDELTSAALPPGSWKVGIKAVDTSGNSSLNAKIIHVDMLNAFDIIFERQSEPRWIGIKTDCLVHDVSGRLVPIDQAAAAGDNFDVFDQYRIDPPDSFIYEAAEFDVGFEYNNMRIWAERATNLGPNEDGVITTSLEIAVAHDGGAYGEFQGWTIGTASARKVIHRLNVDLTQGVGSLEAFNPVVDIQEREEYGAITLSDSGDVTVDFQEPFARAPFIEITVNSDTPAFPAWQNESGAGFDISVFDNEGNRVVPATFYRATGV